MTEDITNGADGGLRGSANAASTIQDFGSGDMSMVSELGDASSRKWWDFF